ncbi:hypothetical protein GH714_016529 [Hevea brasiliensis]|uniref:Pentatricopeptide repeat-containing protein n=1 Tax=Hevea brasiliensis TaxID=3981 RepID=A0A6A6MBR9_HEVBR|nr:hypothetical protein GH714_016529 [Hevea brasiliensis]
MQGKCLRICLRNVVTWNSMIVGYVQNGFYQEAIEEFYNMRLEDIEQSRVNLSGFLSASVNLGAIEEGKQGHAIAILGGFELDNILGSSILNFYSKVGLIEDAELVFSRMVEKDVVSWNLLISCYVHREQIEKALDVCRLMRLENMKFDSVTLASILSACASTKNIKLGREGHCYSIRNNLESDAVVVSGITNMYAKCGRIDDARMQLESVPPNVTSWNALICGFLRNGEINKARDMFSEMQAVGVHPNLATLTSFISGLVDNGFRNEAVLMFQKTQEYGIRPNVVSIINTISACTDVALLLYGRAIHGYIIRHELWSQVPIANALVDMYWNLDEAFRFILPVPLELHLL